MWLRRLSVLLFCLGLWSVGQGYAQFNGCAAGFCYTPASGPWTPANLSGLIGWWKADTNTKVFTDTGCSVAATNGQTVACLGDYSTAGCNLLQATAGSRPTFVTNTLNSLPVLNSATNSYMLSGTCSLGGTTTSVFGVFQSRTASSGRMFAYGVGGSDTVATAFIAAFFPSVTTATAFNNGAKSTGTIVSQSWNQLGSIFDGTNNTLYIGGTAQTPVAATPSFAATGNFVIFANPTGGNTQAAALAEVFMTNTAVSSTDRANIKAYLLAKWGV